MDEADGGGEAAAERSAPPAAPTGAPPPAPLWNRSDVPPWVPGSVVWFLGALVLLGMAWWLILTLRGFLVILLVALFFSFAVEPAVNWLAARGWRRGTATGLVFLVLLVGGSLFLFVMVRLVVDQVSAFIDALPGYLRDIERFVNERFDADISVNDLVDEVQASQSGVQDLASDLGGRAVALSGTVLGVVFNLFTIALFAFYLIAEGPRFRRTVCSVLNPARQRVVLAVWELAIDKTGGYIFSRGLLALASGGASFVVFSLLGVPFAVALAAWVGLLSQFVPVIGTYLAGALPVLVALLNSPIDAVWVLAFILIYQQVENYLLAPRVTARTMAIHPAVAFGAVIVGSSLLGATGALLALPAAAVIQAFVSTYLHRFDVIESELTDIDDDGERPTEPITKAERSIVRDVVRRFRPPPAGGSAPGETADDPTPG